jgi:galactokinase
VRETLKKVQEMKKHLSIRFKEEFGAEPQVYFAPGRINVIGEHLDYNGGKVLPGAIHLGVYVGVKIKSKGTSQIIANSFDESMRFIWGKYEPYPTGNWRNYVLGVLKYLEPHLPMQFEFDMMIDADIPVGSGISSSAALEVGIAFALNDLFNLQLDLNTLADIAHQAENQFVGMKCGIMDQYASALGKADQLLLLDCQTKSYDYIPSALENSEWLLIDSQVKHALAESGYNDRRAESTSAFEKLKEQDPNLKSLADVDDLARYDLELLSLIERKRAKYVVEECARVQHVVEHMSSGNAAAIGHILVEAHLGMKEDYEITCPEVDAIVEEVSKLPFVHGARMMGGGFGGSVLVLAKKATAEQIIPAILTRFIVEFDLTPSYIEVEISGGPRRLK